MNLQAILGAIFLVLFVYLPVNGYIAHNAGTATPVEYIGVGFSIYFWLIFIQKTMTSEYDRLKYSQRHLEEYLEQSIVKIQQMAANVGEKDAKEKDRDFH